MFDVGRCVCCCWRWWRWCWCWCWALLSPSPSEGAGSSPTGGGYPGSGIVPNASTLGLACRVKSFVLHASLGPSDNALWWSRNLSERKTVTFPLSPLCDGSWMYRRGNFQNVLWPLVCGIHGGSTPSVHVHAASSSAFTKCLQRVSGRTQWHRPSAAAPRLYAKVMTG